MEKIEMSVTRDMGQIVGDSLLFVRQNFRLLLRAFVYFMLPLLVINAAFTAFGIKGIFSSMGHLIQGSQGYSGSGYTGAGAFIVISYFVTLVAYVMQNLYMSVYMVLYEHNKEVGLRDVWEGMKKDWKVVLWTYLVMTPLVVMAIGIYVAIIGFGASYDMYVGGFVAFVFFVLLMYALIPLSNIVMIRLRERIGVFHAIGKCFRITAGHWWRTVGAMFVMLIVIYALVLAFFIPFWAYLFITLMHDRWGASTSADPEGGMLMAVYFSLVIVWSFFVSQLFNVLVGTNYYTLSEKYDSLRLKREISEIGTRLETAVRKQEGEY